MKIQFNYFNVINTIRKSLNFIDNNITNHGDEVAYIVYKIASHLNFDKEDLKSLVIASMLHDIGACKTDNLNEFLNFENNSTEKHIVYGYLFIKYFSPIPQMAKTILYHHKNFCDLKDTKEEYMANLINLADSISIMKYMCGSYEKFNEKFIEIVNNENRYNKEYIDILLKLKSENSICENLFNYTYLEELEEFINKIEYTQEELLDYIQLIIFSIDFRSKQTLVHSLAVSATTKEICKILNFTEEDEHLCTVAALLHDIGKIATPVDILKKPGCLSYEEFEVMKDHVCKTRKILEYLGNERVRDIASNHHEKLNGKGYPRGLDYKSLTIEDRVVAIADIFVALTERRYYRDSLSKDEVSKILNRCVLNNEIDKDIVDIVLKNYNRILSSIEDSVDKFNNKMNKIMDEYDSFTF